MLDAVNAIDPALLTRRDAAMLIRSCTSTRISSASSIWRQKSEWACSIHPCRWSDTWSQRSIVIKWFPQHQRPARFAGAATGTPACGTGTFLIAAALAASDAARTEYGDGSVAFEIAGLANRLHGFEILVGPYTVAHYRLLREMAAVGAYPDHRLPIYLADTLAAPGEATGITPRLGFMSGPIVNERRAADALKRDTPIIAI